MKKMNVLKGLLALAVVFLFAQCTDNKGTSTEASAPAVAGTNMKIAYVEVDSLLTKYRYWNDLNELMIQKEENIRTTLNEKAKELDGEMREFQRKLENNGLPAANVQNRKTHVCCRNSATCSSCRKSFMLTFRLKTRRTACSFAILSTHS